METGSIEFAGGRIGQGERLFLIAGPCVIEAEELMLETASRLARLAGELGIRCIFKSSYLKANRSSASSPAGPGLDEGLAVLEKVGRESGLPLCTDIHETAEAVPAAEVADILQIPAFLSRQTALIGAAARTGRVVNIKKGQFMSPELAVLAAGKAREAAPETARVMLTERGTFFGYSDLVVDFRSLQAMAAAGCPLVFDATHSVQRPGGAGERSGGDPQYIPLLARAAVAAGVDGLFLEVHPEPARALSDRDTMLSLDEAERLLPGLVELADHVRDK